MHADGTTITTATAYTAATTTASLTCFEHYYCVLPSLLQGRDVGVSQITGFTAKISMGNGMQARSREVARLAQQLDFPRLLTFYYSSVGGFLTQCFLVRSSTVLRSFCGHSVPILSATMC
jgi:1,3-beta-glucan synthase component